MSNYISKLNVKGAEYLIKDSEARASIISIQSALNSVIRFKGVSTTEIKADGAQVPANIYATGVKPALGDMVLYDKKEFVWITSQDSKGTDTSHWVLLDALDAYGDLASKDVVIVNTADAHAHKVTINTYTGAVTTSTGSFTPAGTVSLAEATDSTGCKPKLEVTDPTIDVSGELVNLTTTTIPAVTEQSVTTGFSAGTLPELTITKTSIPNVTAVGSLPSLTKSNVDVLKSVKSAGTVPSITVDGEAVTTFNALVNTTNPVSASVNAANETLTLTDLDTAAVAFSAGAMPTFNTGTATNVSAWSAGTLPTLGQAITVGSASGWSRGTLPSASTATVLKKDGSNTVTVATGAESVLTAVPTAIASGTAVAFAKGIKASFAGSAGDVSVSGTAQITAGTKDVDTKSAGSHTHTVSYN